MRCLLGGMGCEYSNHEEVWVNADRGRYVWGDNVHKAKTQCERYVLALRSAGEGLDRMYTDDHSLDYIFQLAVEMHKLGLPWVKKS
jgi:methylthioribulose-1-phosphate dehydratase